MSSFTRLCALASVAGLSLMLAACSTGDSSYYPSQVTTPRDHPPPPKRRPDPPPAFLAELARDGGSPGVATAEGRGPLLATSTASRVAVEVQPLAPPTARAPEPAVQAAPRPAATRPVAEAAAPQPADGSYRVQPGDTLYSISRRLGVPLDAIAGANGLTAPYNLRVSENLIIPRQRQHRVARGETVYGISRGYGVEVSELARQNGISPPYSISPGRLLIIPDATTAAPPIETAAGRDPAPAPQLAETPTAASTAPVPGRAMAAIPKPPPLEGGKFLWPIEGKILADFGPRPDGQHNDGINILAPRGAPVRAAENGVVAYAGEELRGFGRLLLIKHAEGWVTAYAHNDSLLVQRGDKVRRGQPVAKVGSSGNVARPQLHFEVRKGARAIDPRQLLQASGLGGAG